MFDGDEYEDQISGDPNGLDDLIEARDLNPLEDERPEEEHEDDQNQEKDDGEGETTKPKKKRVLNPQPKLDAIRLTGSRGISAIEGLFSDFKFHGSGHEEQDLKRVLEKLELWGNRLFPKYQFDDLLEKVEKVGQKRTVMNFVNRVRMGLEEELVAGNAGDSANDDDVMDADKPRSPQGNNVASTDDLFTQLLEDQISQISASQKREASPAKTQTTISEEQRERMLQNRRLAEERRLARLKGQQEMISERPEIDLTPKAHSPKSSDISKFEDEVHVLPIENIEHGVVNESAEANMNEKQSVVVTDDHENSVEKDMETKNCADNADPNSNTVNAFAID